MILIACRSTTAWRSNLHVVFLRKFDDTNSSKFSSVYDPILKEKAIRIRREMFENGVPQAQVLFSCRAIVKLICA